MKNHIAPYPIKILMYQVVCWAKLQRIELFPACGRDSSAINRFLSIPDIFPEGNKSTTSNVHRRSSCAEKNLSFFAEQ